MKGLNMLLEKKASIVWKRSRLLILAGAAVATFALSGCDEFKNNRNELAKQVDEYKTAQQEGKDNIKPTLRAFRENQ